MSTPHEQQPLPLGGQEAVQRSALYDIPKLVAIRGLRNNTETDVLARVSASREVLARAGERQYRLNLTLVDETASMEAVLFPNDYAQLKQALDGAQPEGSLLRTRGRINVWKARTNIVLEWRPGTSQVLDDPSLCVPSYPLDLDAARREFDELLAAFPEPHRTLLHAAFPQEIRERFLLVPAAKSHHHAKRHGLYRHTMECEAFAWRYAERYGADPWLARTVAVLHDYGKIFTYGFRNSVPTAYVTELLIGHLRLGAMQLARVFHALESDGVALPSGYEARIEHAVLCHYGAYDAPQKPVYEDAHELVWFAADAVRLAPAADLPPFPEDPALRELVRFVRSGIPLPGEQRARVAAESAFIDACRDVPVRVVDPELWRTLAHLLPLLGSVESPRVDGETLLRPQEALAMRVAKGFEHLKRSGLGRIDPWRQLALATTIFAAQDPLCAWTPHLPQMPEARLVVRADGSSAKHESFAQCCSESDSPTGDVDRYNTVLLARGFDDTQWPLMD